MNELEHNTFDLSIDIADTPKHDVDVVTEVLKIPASPEDRISAIENLSEQGIIHADAHTLRRQLIVMRRRRRSNVQIRALLVRNVSYAPIRQVVDVDYEDD